MFHVPNKYRITDTRFQYASTIEHGNNGLFEINRGRTVFVIIASDEYGWEHVSVHCTSEGKDRTPTWSEMCFIKDIFWDDTDCVIQYHPAKSEYVNCHKHTLHLWRPTNQPIPIPNKLMV